MLMTTQTVARCLAKRAFLLAPFLSAAALAQTSGLLGSAPQTESVQSFAGTVSCVDVVNPARSKTWETRVGFNRPIGRDMGAGAPPVAVQLGGLAGEWIGGRKRSQVDGWIAGAVGGTGGNGGLLGTAPNQLHFTISANTEWGSYAEAGAWTIGVDANGKATLQGRSRAATVVDSSAEAPARVATLSPREPSLPLAVPQNPQIKPWSATCTWNLSAAAAPAGVIAYDYYTALLAPPTTASSFGLKAAGGCGSVFALSSSGFTVLAKVPAFASLATVFTVAKVVTSLAGDAAANACLDRELAAMNQQLAIQAAQIQQIDTFLGMATNALYTAWYVQKVDDAGTSAYLWNQNLKGLSPSGVGDTGLFGNFMVPNGVGLWGYDLKPSATAASDPLQLALDDIAFSNANTQAVAGGASFRRYVSELSGTDVIIPNGAECTPDCTAQVAQAPGTALINLYEDLFDQLSAGVASLVPAAQAFGTELNQNIVPLYDQHNALLVKFWTQGVFALEQALSMEWMVNQMNYFRATSTTNPRPLPQIPSWGGVPGTHYQYGGQSPAVEANNYNVAQERLVKLYAARVNQLYLNTLNYAVSDVPVVPQAYPTGPVTYTVNGVAQSGNPVDYAGQVGKNLVANLTGAVPSQGRTPLSLLPPVADGAWKSAAVLYQFEGMKDVASCVNTLQAYTGSNPAGTVPGWLATPTNCPAIFTLADGSPLSYTCDPNDTTQCTGSIYDGNTLRPYTSFQASGATGGPVALSTQLTNNLKFCDAASPALYWDTRGATRLNCGNWYTPQYKGPVFPRANWPEAMNNPNYYALWDYIGGPFDGVANATLPGDCSNNWSFKDQKFPALTTITGSWPTGQPSSCSVIPTVGYYPTGTRQAPLLQDARLLTGNYETGNTTQGCTIGWIGGGASNRLPDYWTGSFGSNYSPPDVDYAAFGLRLPRALDNASQGGFVLPMAVYAGCSADTVSSAAKYSRQIVDIGPQIFVQEGSSYIKYGDLTRHGYSCRRKSAAQWSCVIADNTEYTITIKSGRAWILDVQRTAP